MALLVPYETETGYAVGLAKNATERTAVRAEEKRRAIAECRRRSIPVQDDDTRTAYTLYGLCKNDGRPPREGELDGANRELTSGR